eukprot:g13660.t1
MAWRIISVVTLGSVTVISAASTDECANLVPLEDRRRGKGAFSSGCTSRSTSGRGGCWDSLVEEHSGCQSCIVQGGAAAGEWSSSVFSKNFEVELDPCPSSVAENYGTPEGGIVSFEEVQSGDCGDGWFSFEASCYYKSSYLEAATTWQDADSRCGEMGARLVSIESESENDFIVETLLWIGFLGEAYTGLRKKTGDGDWSWIDSLAGSSPGYFDPASSYQDWGAGLDASSSYESTGASCLEITPYLPKTWNPFSCEVNKQFVCEKPAPPGITDNATLVSRTPAPTVLLEGISSTTATVAPSPSPTHAPTALPTLAQTLQANPSPRSIATTAPTTVSTTVSPASPAPSSLATTSSGGADQGQPRGTGGTRAPVALATSSTMPSFLGSGSPTASPTSSSPFDINGAGRLRTIGMGRQLLVVVLFALGLLA